MTSHQGRPLPRGCHGSTRHRCAESNQAETVTAAVTGDHCHGRKHRDPDSRLKHLNERGEAGRTKIPKVAGTCRITYRQRPSSQERATDEQKDPFALLVLGSDPLPPRETVAG